MVITAIVVEIRGDKLAKFWKYPSKQPVNKYPTIEDIRRKYPKRVSQEQLRTQAKAKDDAEAKRKQEIIDRNIKEIRSAKDALRDRQEDHQRKVDAMRASKANNPKTNETSTERKNREVREAADRREQERLDAIQAYRQNQTSKKTNISSTLFRQLVKMVNGREDVARRLIEGNLKLFPDKSPDWACDKAIADLERDRRI